MRSVDPESVFGTYRLDLMDRFWDAGLDFADRHALAWHLAEHSSNRPLYGWTRRHREHPRIARDLNIALLHAVDNKREKAVHLLLWAGADPRARVPMLQWMSQTDEDDDDLYSAIEHATSFGRSALLPVLKPDPARDDFVGLYAAADNPDVLKYLVRLQAPKDWTPAILRNLFRLDNRFGSQGAKGCLDFIASQGGRLGPLTPEKCGDVRRCLLRLDESDFGDLLSWLSDPACCEPATYAEITRTPSMKSRLRRAKSEAERRRRGW